MDVIIPSHNLKIFSTAISTLTRIGGHLYIEFDPLDGLSLRTINDAKSAYGEFQFDVGFFERCSCPPGSSALYQRRRKKDALLRRQRRQKKERLLREREGLGRLGRRRKRRRFLNQQNSSEPPLPPPMSGRAGDQDDDDDDDDEDGMAEKFTCRVPIRTVASILKSRKGVSSLRIKSVGTQLSNSNDNNSNNENEERVNATQDSDMMMTDNNEDLDQYGPQLQLAFEFNVSSSGVLRIIHKVGITTDVDGVVAVTSKENCNEIMAEPKVCFIYLGCFDNCNIGIILIYS